VGQFLCQPFHGAAHTSAFCQCGHVAQTQHDEALSGDRSCCFGAVRPGERRGKFLAAAKSIKGSLLHSRTTCIGLVAGCSAWLVHLLPYLCLNSAGWRVCLPHLLFHCAVMWRVLHRLRRQPR
jgi:hypothetical protein